MAVVIETTLGDITVDLYLEQRPVTCLNFLKLCKMKYYNYNLFHTIRSGFIAQTGDPTGEGSGGMSIFGILEGPDKRFFSGEKMPKIRHTDAGLLSMVGTGDMMIGSQFFFTLGSDLDSLDGSHCVIGEVTEGHDILRKLNDVICDETHRPYQDVRITHTIVLEDPFNDPIGLSAPSRSPSPSAERLKGGRIAPDEDIDETQGRSAAEIQEIVEEKEAKARATILEIVGDIPDADIAPPENVLFVCKLNPVTTDDDLEIIFSRFGKINSCEVIRDKKTGDSLQYAFIEFADKKSCEEAYFKMDNVLIDDRRIHVDFSQSVSKIKWLGKGRGVKYMNDEDISKDKIISGDNTKHPKSKDRKDDENNKIHDKKQHVRDRERHKESRNHDRDKRNDPGNHDRDKRIDHGNHDRDKRNDQGSSYDRKHREDRNSKSYKDRRERSRSRSKRNVSKDRASSRHDANQHKHIDSKTNKSNNDCKRYSNSHEHNKEKHDYSRSHRSRSDKSPSKLDQSISSKSSKDVRDKTCNKEDKLEKHNNYRDDSKSESRNSRHRHLDQGENANYKPIKNNNLKRKSSNIEEKELDRNNTKKKSRHLEPRTPSPSNRGTEKKVREKKVSKGKQKGKPKNKKTIKKKRKSSSSSDSDSSDSTSSSSESSSSTDSDNKKKRARRKHRKISTTSSSTSSDSSSSTSSSGSSSDSSSSSSDSERKKKKATKKKVNKTNKKKS